MSARPSAAVSAVLPALLAGLLAVVPVRAQLGGLPGLRGDAPAPVETEPEGATLDVVAALPGFGDGRVTERDAKAFAAYCVWGWNRAFASEGVALELGPDAEARMLDFWIHVWDHVEPELKAVVSHADVLWPQLRTRWEEGDANERAVIEQEFFLLLADVWGGIEEQTVYYLAGEMPGVQYAGVVDAAIAARAGGPGGPAGTSADGSMPFSAPQPPGYADGSYEPPVNDGMDYMINDGSGTMVFQD
jgi:hypothetical protein